MSAVDTKKDINREDILIWARFSWPRLPDDVYIIDLSDIDFGCKMHIYEDIGFYVTIHYRSINRVTAGIGFSKNSGAVFLAVNLKELEKALNGEFNG